MSTNVRHDRLFYWVAGLLSISMMTMFWAWQVSRVCFVLLGLTGFYLMVKNRHTQMFSDSERVVIWVVLAYYAIALVSAMSNGMPKLSVAILTDRYIFLLFLAPLLYLYKRVQLSPQSVWMVAAASGVAVGIVAIVDYYVLQLGRAEGNSNAIRVGFISATLLMTLLCGYRYAFSSITAAAVLAVSATLSTIALTLTLSRGAWLGFTVCMFCMLIWVIRNYSHKHKVLVALVFLSLFAAVGQMSFVQSRVHSVIKELRTYHHEVTTGEIRHFSSLALRMEMWRLGWQMFQENPFLGVGPYNYKPVSREMVARGGYYPVIAGWNHPHSQYVTSLATRGVFGILGLVVLFVVPWMIFWRALHGRASLQGIAGAGLLLLIGYTINGFTEPTLEHRKPIIVFTQGLALCLALIASKKNTLTDPNHREHGRARDCENPDEAVPDPARE